MQPPSTMLVWTIEASKPTRQHSRLGLAWNRGGSGLCSVLESMDGTGTGDVVVGAGGVNPRFQSRRCKQKYD